MDDDLKIFEGLKRQMELLELHNELSFVEGHLSNAIQVILNVFIDRSKRTNEQ